MALEHGTTRAVDFDILCKNERDFVDWYNTHYVDKKVVCSDFWQSNITYGPVHHFILVNGDRKIHISFSKISIICSKILKNREKDIYKGYEWKYCREELEKYLWK